MSGNSIGQSIQRVGGSAGPGAYKGRLTAQTQAGFSPIKQRITDSANPITGGLGSQSHSPRGVQPGFGGVASLPPGRFQNTGAPGGLGGSGAPQNGDGNVAKSGQNDPQKAAGTSNANPYGKTTPPGQSPNDAFTNALLQKVLNDRKKGEEAVQRTPDKKISDVDREKAQLDEETKAKVDKLTEAFKKDAGELEKSIALLQKNFKEYLTGDKGNEKDKDLNRILNDIVAKSKIDEKGNEAGSNKYNPQGFFDAAEKLDTWIDKNPDDAKKYGEALTKINNQVQSMTATAREEIALHENKSERPLRAAELTAKISGDEAGKLKVELEKISDDPKSTETDKQAISDFLGKLDEGTKAINPDNKEAFNRKSADESLETMKSTFEKIPPEIRNNPELTNSFNKIYDLGKVSAEGQALARTDTSQPNSINYQKASKDFVNNLDAALKKHRTEEQETDVRTIIKDDPFVNKFIAEYQADKKPETEGGSRPEASSQETKRREALNDIDAMFTTEDTDAITDVIDGKRSDTEDLDLNEVKEDIEDLTEDSVDDAIDNAVEDIEIPDRLEELELDLD
jgi:hypothetical protein